MQARTAIPQQLLTFTLALSSALALAHAQDPNANAGQVDPPGRVARIAFTQGNASLEPAGVDTFSQAEINYPLTNGDRVYVDTQSLAELQTSGLAVRLGNGADVTLSSLNDDIAQFGLAQGSIRVRTYDLTTPDGTSGTVEIDTPNGTILVLEAGDIRVDSYPQNDTTVVTVTSGKVELTGPGIDQTAGANESIELAGNPVTTRRMQMLAPDALDSLDASRDAQYNSSIAAEGQYVDPEVIGAGDLTQYGDWMPDAAYGYVWYPRTVEVGWVPYHNGHWAWVAPWGWTWVEYEPWGFAPFHYGRWSNFGGRWGWIPGPPTGILGRGARPYYSPALVAFVGGPGFSLSVGFGGASGAGVTAWFPLGPSETYVPWYHASPVYVNRVNVTNIYTRNAAQVRNVYVNRSTTVYNVTNVTYVNRTVATTAVTQRDFAAGRSVVASQPVRLDANARAQLNAAPVLPHPLVTPAAAIAAPQAAARALPPNMARPVLARQQPGAAAGPVVTTRSAPTYTPRAPVTAQPAPQPATPQQRGRQPEAQQPVASVAAPRPAAVSRPLVNQAAPAPVQPPFQQQRVEIERNDPGRPLGPQQVENMRQGRPAGQPTQAEPAHPPATSRPAPPPARTPPPPPKKP